MADDSANPTFIAADLLSQAEHGPDSQAILVCTSERIASETQAEISRLSKNSAARTLWPDRSPTAV